ncbi:hypothetical protein CBR_g29443 [Chara braunii]|uniref:Uncharacterized protein n=1 Tax=Chara braunii TaxID=69332 RepID=A0A388LAT2_CHABU|nr:hypothetical protein CBR_g29443 [Chara braunii]|eukprot:GBG79293.1 hypothetical protein CBR_g29443 [Chara braunii]
MGGVGRGDSGGLLPAPSSSNAIVPYVAPQSKGYSGNSYSGGYDNSRQRYSKPWNGGYKDRDRDRDEKIDRLFELMSEQIEEREQRKREAAQLELLQEEKKRLQAEEDKRVQADGGKEKSDVGREDEILAMQLQIKELSQIRSALEEKNAELAQLKTENSHLRKDFRELWDEIASMRGKRDVATVTESSPPEESAKGKQKVNPSLSAMYTPKDLEALRKAYKQALEAKDMALKEAEMAKERVARLAASWIHCSARKASAWKSAPRNLRTSFQAVEIESEDDGDGPNRNQGGDKSNARPIVEVAHDLEEAKVREFREVRLKELRPAKKADMELACEEEGISYFKMDQAKTDVAEIRARRDYDSWLQDKERQGKQKTDEDDEDRELNYATSTEEVNEG